jgi:hypothetical protein
MLLRVSVPVEAGNAAAKAGTLGPTIEGGEEAELEAISATVASGDGRF